MTTLKFYPTHSACVRQADLKKAITLLSKAVPKKPSAAIFSAVKVEIGTTYVTLTAATTESAMVVEIPTTAPALTTPTDSDLPPSSNPNVSWALTSLPQLSTLSAITYGDVCLHLSLEGFAGSPHMFPNEQPDSTVADLMFQGDRNSRKNWLGYMDGKVETFPALPSCDSAGRINEEPATVLAEVPWQEANKILPWVMKAAPRSDLRYYLNGICLDSTARHCNFVATDGHRLHRWTDDRSAVHNPVGMTLEGYIKEEKVIWPEAYFDILKTFVKEGSRLTSKGLIGEPLRFRLHEDIILTTFMSDDLRVKVAVQKVNGTYVPYNRVIPALSDRPTRVSMSSSQAIKFAKTLKAIKPEGRAQFGFVKLFDGDFRDLSSNDDAIKVSVSHVYKTSKETQSAGGPETVTKLTGEFSAEVGSKTFLPGLNPVVALNTAYLADALEVAKAAEGQVNFYSREGFDNTVTTAGDCLAVVMPMRV